MNENDYMLWFSLISGITLKRKLELLNIFDNCEKIFYASQNDFYNLKIFESKTISSIINSRDKTKFFEYKAELKKKAISFVNIKEETYPYFLKHIEEPPIVLYYKGRLPLIENQLISIVGTRKCSSYGKSVTEFVSRELAKNNIGIVSGLASGIDTIAHETTLKENGYTIAVVGNGLDICYPKENFSLMDKIAKNGLLLSEYPPGTEPKPYHFPRRNRIVAGISSATIVTEAPKRSGALITATIALSEGREVLTFPADIFRKSASGNNELIKSGAVPITEIDDVLFTMDYKKNTNIAKIGKEKINIQNNDVLFNEQKNNEVYFEKEKEIIKEKKIDIDSISDEESNLLELITYDGVDAQYLSVKSGYKIEKVQYLLTMLELNELVTKTAEQKFIKIKE